MRVVEEACQLQSYSGLLQGVFSFNGGLKEFEANS